MRYLLMTSFALLNPSDPLSHFLQQELVATDLGDLTSFERADLLLWAPDIRGKTGVEMVRFSDKIRVGSGQSRTLLMLSSSAVYGEGMFECGDCGPVSRPQRLEADLMRKRWELYCPTCGEMMMPIPLKEEAPVNPTSEEGWLYVQAEQAVRREAEEQGFRLVIFRLFHPYWPGAGFLNQPRRDVIATAIHAFQTKQPPEVAEDGNQTRDLTFGSDIISAVKGVLSLESGRVEVFNIGSGRSVALFNLVAHIQESMGMLECPLCVMDTHQFGHVRHRTANIDKARRLLGYIPQVPLLQGLSEVIASASSQD